MADVDNKKILKITDDFQGWNEGQSQQITFVVTEDCQLRCKYCYICGKNQFNVMSFETAKKAIDYVLSRSDVYNEKSVTWDFIGGEPFLEIDLIDKICDYIKLRTYELSHPWFDNYRFSFSTNGLLYRSDAVQRFIKKNLAHLSVSVSLDGNKEKHDAQRIFPDGRGSYDAVLKAIPLWLEQFPQGGVKATIGRDDLKYVKDSVLHLYELGITQVNMNTIYEDVWQDGDDELFEEQLRELADVIIEKEWYRDYQCTLFSRVIGFPMDAERENQNWCGAGSMLAFGTNGALYPCLRFIQYSLERREEKSTGDLTSGRNVNLLRPFMALDRVSQSPQKCLDCEVAFGCAWCQGNNYDCAETETIYQRATYICKMHKARVRANNYLWNKLDKIVPPVEDDDRVRKLRKRKGLTNLLVLLDSNAPSFCYYPTPEQAANPTRISAETLKKVVYLALTENLTLNLIAGSEPLSAGFKEILKDVDYMVYRPYSAVGGDGVENVIDVFDFENDVWDDAKTPSPFVALRIELANVERLPEWLAERSLSFERVSVFVKGIETATDADLERYRAVLDALKSWLPEREELKPLNLSILTDRLQLDAPNHCDAGVKHMTVGPDGKFYVCPGFYYREKNDDFVAGDVDSALKTHEIPIKNKQLLRLDRAPICKDCDAFHCRRCVWLNKTTTREVNTPSRQQCVMAHHERNASRDLIEPLYIGDMVQIPEIDYLDPFDELMKKRRPQPQTNEGKTNEC